MESREFRFSLLVIKEKKAVKEGEKQGKRKLKKQCWLKARDADFPLRQFVGARSHELSAARPTRLGHREEPEGTLLVGDQCEYGCAILFYNFMNVWMIAATLWTLRYPRTLPAFLQKHLRLIEVQGAVNITRGMLQRTLWSI